MRSDPLDPASELMKALEQATTEQEVRRILHAKGLFPDGFKNIEDIYQATKRKLDEIVQDTRSHRQKGADPHFSLRYCSVLPFIKLITAIARKEGWDKEGLMLQIMRLLAFIENPATTLKVTQEEKHHRTPNMSGLSAIASSARKTSRSEFVFTILFGLGPEDWQGGATSVYLTPQKQASRKHSGAMVGLPWSASKAI